MGKVGGRWEEEGYRKERRKEKEKDGETEETTEMKTSMGNYEGPWSFLI